MKWSHDFILGYIETLDAKYTLGSSLVAASTAYTHTMATSPTPGALLKGGGGAGSP